LRSARARPHWQQRRMGLEWSAGVAGAANTVRHPQSWHARLSPNSVDVPCLFMRLPQKETCEHVHTFTGCRSRLRYVRGKGHSELGQWAPACPSLFEPAQVAGFAWNPGAGKPRYGSFLLGLGLCSCLLPVASLLPLGASGRGVACHKLVGHAEQVPQYIQIDARQANQHAGIADVMVRHIINIGVRSEQFSAIIKIHGNDKRTRFGRAMSRDTRQEFSTDLECRGPVRGAVLDAGQSKSDLPYRVEVDCPSRHWFRTHCSFLARYRHEYASAGWRACDYHREVEPFQEKSFRSIRRIPEGWSATRK